jgi:hypothetical protein
MVITSNIIHSSLHSCRSTFPKKNCGVLYGTAVCLSWKAQNKIRTILGIKEKVVQRISVFRINAARWWKQSNTNWIYLERRIT